MSARRRLVALVSTGALAAAGAVVVPLGPAGAATIDVGPTEADLRAAFATADASGEDDTLVLTPGALYELTCPGGQLTHTANDGLTILGNGAVIAQTCPDERVLQNTGTGLLTVEDLTITGGDTGADGGGIRATGPVVVQRSSIVDNRSGAFRVTNDLTLIDSTVAGNTHGDGSIVTVEPGAATLVNSTITENTSAGNRIVFGEDGVTLVYTTIAGNSGTESVGSSFLGPGSDPSLTAFASVVTGTDEGGAACDLFGDVPSISFGYNYSTDSSCEWTDPTDTQDGADPMLAPLASHGGPTPTMPPLAGSPLIDAIPVDDCQIGPAVGITTDQRGVSRPQGPGCDIGAVELEVDVHFDPPGPLPPDGGPPGAPRPAPPITATPRLTG